MLQKEEKYFELAEAVDKALAAGTTKPDVQQGLFLMKADALIRLSQFVEGQELINLVYEQAKKEDPMYFRALSLQKVFYEKIIECPETPQNQKKTLKTKQCDNYFKFLDFLDKKKKFEKMLEEVETYVVLLY